MLTCATRWIARPLACVCDHQPLGVSPSTPTPAPTTTISLSPTLTCKGTHAHACVHAIASFTGNRTVEHASCARLTQAVERLCVVYGTSHMQPWSWYVKCRGAHALHRRQRQRPAPKSRAFAALAGQSCATCPCMHGATMHGATMQSCTTWPLYAWCHHACCHHAELHHVAPVCMVPPCMVPPCRVAPRGSCLHGAIMQSCPTWPLFAWCHHAWCHHAELHHVAPSCTTWLLFAWCHHAELHHVAPVCMVPPCMVPPCRVAPRGPCMWVAPHMNTHASPEFLQKHRPWQHAGGVAGAWGMRGWVRVQGSHLICILRVDPRARLPGCRACRHVPDDRAVQAAAPQLAIRGSADGDVEGVSEAPLLTVSGLDQDTQARNPCHSWIELQVQLVGKCAARAGTVWIGNSCCANSSTAGAVPDPAPCNNESCALRPASMSLPHHDLQQQRQRRHRRDAHAALTTVRTPGCSAVCAMSRSTTFVPLMRTTCVRVCAPSAKSSCCTASNCWCWIGMSVGTCGDAGAQAPPRQRQQQQRHCVQVTQGTGGEGAVQEGCGRGSERRKRTARGRVVLHAANA
eukprot:364938-Chlamydomonas_euryale.AAC.14